jgi:hypothetical protein
MSKSSYDARMTDMIDALVGMFWISYLEHVEADDSDITFKEYLSAVVVEHQKETAKDVLDDCLRRAPSLYPSRDKRRPPTPGFSKLGSSAKQAAMSRAKNFYPFD